MKNIILPNDVIYILNLLQSNGFQSFVVGGCVRDSLLGREPKDWDITTNCKPEDVISIFESKGYKVVPNGIKFGMVTIMINNVGYEVTTFRIDKGYEDHRHSNGVDFVNDITLDLARRDFTINAMAYSPNVGLVDPYNGMNDLQKKIVVCVNDPNERFREDALRMLRAVRFSSQLDFSIEEATFNAISKNADTLQFISQERIRDELTKILLSNIPSMGIDKLVETGLMQFIVPELLKCVGFDQHNIHHDKDIYKHTLSVVDNTNKDIIVRLAALLHDIGKPNCYTVGDNGQGRFREHDDVGKVMSIDILKRLKFDNDTINLVSMLIGEHMHTGENYKKPAIKRLITRVGKDNLDRLFNLQIADRKSSAPEFQDFSSIVNMGSIALQILNEKTPLSVKDLAINGSDLISIGYKPGKQLGQKLNKLFNLVIDEIEPNEKNRLLELAKIDE